MGECTICLNIFDFLIDLKCNHRICTKCQDDYSKVLRDEQHCYVCYHSINSRPLDLLPGIDKNQIEQAKLTLIEILRKLRGYPNDFKDLISEFERDLDKIQNFTLHLEVYLRTQRYYPYLLDRYNSLSLLTKDDFHVLDGKVVRFSEPNEYMLTEISEGDYIVEQYYWDGKPCKDYSTPLIFQSEGPDQEIIPVEAEQIGEGKYSMSLSANLWISLCGERIKLPLKYYHTCYYSSDPEQSSVFTSSEEEDSEDSID